MAKKATAAVTTPAVSPALDYVGAKGAGNDYGTWADIMAVPAYKEAWEANGYLDENGEVYGPVNLGKHEDGSQDWLQFRAHHAADPSDPNWVENTISPSGAACILGLDTYKTARELLWEKVPETRPNDWKPEEPNPERMLAGHIGEAFVAAIAATELKKLDPNCVIYYDDTLYGSSQMKEIAGNPDRLAVVNGVPGGLELKTATSTTPDTKDYWSKGICPPHYEAQVRLYMHIFNVPYWYICAWWGFGPDEHVLIRIERDMDVEEFFLGRAHEFIGFCDRKEQIPLEWEASDGRIIKQMQARQYGAVPTSTATVGDKKSIEIPDDGVLGDAADRLIALTDEEEAINTRLKEIADERDTLVAKFVDATGGVPGVLMITDPEDVPRFVRIKAHMTKASLNEQALADQEPEIYQKCCVKFDPAYLRKTYGAVADKFTVPGAVKVGRDGSSGFYTDKAWKGTFNPGKTGKTGK